MSQLLHDTFDELADELGVQPAPPHAAGAAWRTGRRRVVRRRVVGSVATAFVALLLATLVWPAAVPTSLVPAGRAGGATSHPLRVTKSWFGGELPTKGAPLAALVLSAPDRSPYGSSEWLTVDVDGDVHRLPAGLMAERAMPAVSPDGTWVAYSEKGTDRYVVRNVVDGTRHAAQGLTTVQPNTTDGTWSGATAVVGSQTPAFWSPDSRLLATRVTSGDGTEFVALVSRDGSVRRLPWRVPPLLAGWVDDSHLLAVDGGGDTSSIARPAIVDVETGERRQLPALQPARPFEGTEVSQWSPAVQPGGRRLVMSREPARDNDLSVPWSVFDLATGRETAQGSYRTQLLPTTTSIKAWLQWRGDTPVLAVPTGAGTLLGTGVDPSDATMLVDPRLDAVVVLVAQQALDGPANGSVWGHGTNWFVWRWRETALVLAVIVAFVLLSRRGGRLAQRDVERDTARDTGRDAYPGDLP